jgi:hypothetical protein
MEVDGGVPGDTGQGERQRVSAGRGGCASWAGGAKKRATVAIKQSCMRSCTLQLGSWRRDGGRATNKLMHRHRCRCR